MSLRRATIRNPVLVFPADSGARYVFYLIKGVFNFLTGSSIHPKASRTMQGSDPVIRQPEQGRKAIEPFENGRACACPFKKNGFWIGGQYGVIEALLPLHLKVL